MDYQISPECSYSGSQETLLPGKQLFSRDTTAFNPKRALRPSTTERCLRKASSLQNLKEAKETQNSRICQRSTSRQIDCELRLLPLRPHPEEITPLTLDTSDEEVTAYDQPSTTEKPRAVEETTSQPQDDLKIGSLEIITNLKAIISGKGLWEKIAHSCIRCCSDMDQSTDDQEWLDYLSEEIQTVDKKTSKEYRPNEDRELRTLIQVIMFCTLKTFHRYKSSMKNVKQEYLNSLNDAIQRVLQQYYQKFGEELFWQILNPETYPKRTIIHLARYHHAPWYDHDAIPKTLTKLLAPTATELNYLPVLRDLISIKAAKADMDTETALGFGEQAMQKMAERREEKRLLTLFTHRPLGTNFSPVASIEGFLNFNNTCFAAVFTWQILASSYIHLISSSSHPEAIECSPEEVDTEQDEGFISLTSEEKAIPLSSLSPEECLTLVKKVSDRDAKTVLLTAATRKCLVTMESQYRKKQYSEMQNTYKLFLTLCTACASDDIFVGFEDFHERYIKFISSQLLEKEAEDKKTGNKQSTEEPGQEDRLPVFPLKY